jgi:hypothetical protein
MKLLIQSLLQQESQPSALCFGRGSKTGREVGKLFTRRKKIDKKSFHYVLIGKIKAGSPEVRHHMAAGTYLAFSGLP